MTPENNLFVKNNSVVDENIYYKLINPKNDDERDAKDPYFIVPRESYIKKNLQLLNLHNLNAAKENVLVEGFYGEEPGLENQDESDIDSLKQKHLNFQSLRTLPVFRDIDPEEILSMSTGHARNPSNPNSIDRILIVRHENKMDVIGAINFELYLDDNRMEIHNFGVIPNEQHKGLGSLLLESALLVTMLYGIDSVSADSTIEGAPVYLKHGFYLTFDDGESDTYITDFNILKNIPLGHLNLELSIDNCFQKLNALIGIPDINQETYLLSKEWNASAELFNDIEGKVTEEELMLFTEQLKISDESLASLKAQITPVIPVNQHDSKKRSREMKDELISLKKVKLDDNFANEENDSENALQKPN
jgi:hypothetical protein